MKTQLVPVEPTKKMLDAFDAQDSLHYNPANKSEQYKARHAWKAMLKAAPTPEDEPLYTRPDNNNSKLRKAAEEVLRCFDLNSRYSVGFEIACENLRTAMEEKK